MAQKRKPNSYGKIGLVHKDRDGMKLGWLWNAEDPWNINLMQSDFILPRKFQIYVLEFQTTGHFTLKPS